jgi:hypothetical protein
VHVFTRTTYIHVIGLTCQTQRCALRLTPAACSSAPRARVCDAQSCGVAHECLIRTYEHATAARTARTILVARLQPTDCQNISLSGGRLVRARCVFSDSPPAVLVFFSFYFCALNQTNEHSHDSTLTTCACSRFCGLTQRACTCTRRPLDTTH